jgi:hypothetical protein
MHFFDPNQTQALPSWVPNQRSGPNNGSALTPKTMQADYVAWRACLTRWKHDAAHWQAEHDALLKRLADMQRFVVEHGTSLTAHEAAFGAVEQSLAEFERLIATHPDAEHMGLAEPMESRHRELSARVRHIDDAHQRMARHHAEVGSRMVDLERATAAPL